MSEGFFMNSPEPPMDFEKFFNLPNIKVNPSEPLFQQDKQVLDKITEQMNQLMEQIKELEKSQSELLDRLPEKK